MSHSLSGLSRDQPTRASRERVGSGDETIVRLPLKPVEVWQMASAGSPPRKRKLSRDEREVRGRKKESNRPQSSHRY